MRKSCNYIKRKWSNVWLRWCETFHFAVFTFLFGKHKVTLLQKQKILIVAIWWLWCLNLNRCLLDFFLSFPEVIMLIWYIFLNTCKFQLTMLLSHWAGILATVQSNSVCLCRPTTAESRWLSLQEECPAPPQLQPGQRAAGHRPAERMTFRKGCSINHFKRSIAFIKDLMLT